MSEQTKKTLRDDLRKYTWKAGQSGNPSGKIKGTKNLSTQLKEILDLEIEGIDTISGETISAPVRYFLNNRLLRNALNGDNRALQEIYDRLEGKPKQKLDITADMKVKGLLCEAIKKARTS